MLYCSPACAIPWCWWVRGCKWLDNSHLNHARVEEKAMQSMGPPHAYVCGLLIKLLHYTIFLKSPFLDVSECGELSRQGFVYILVVPF